MIFVIMYTIARFLTNLFLAVMSFLFLYSLMFVIFCLSILLLAARLHVCLLLALLSLHGSSNYHFHFSSVLIRLLALYHLLLFNTLRDPQGFVAQRCQFESISCLFCCVLVGYFAHNFKLIGWSAMHFDWLFWDDLSSNWSVLLSFSLSWDSSILCGLWFVDLFKPDVLVPYLWLTNLLVGYF